MQVRETVEKSRNTVFSMRYSMFGGYGWSKSRLAPAAIRSHLVSGEIKNSTLIARADFEVKIVKALHCRSAFGSSDVDIVYATVVRSTLASQNAKSTAGSDHY